MGSKQQVNKISGSIEKQQNFNKMSQNGDVGVIKSANSESNALRPGQVMDHALSYEFGFARESWCCVEMKKEQDWCRATRKNFKDHFKSSAFSETSPIEAEPRCSWSVNAPSHREKRHFPSTYDNQLKL